ncbi:MAG: TetR/AcrR family transcriptional regulator [Mycoplasmatales bacterium]
MLDVSTTLFYEKGYEQTSIQDIIHSLGNLTKGAIYHHFDSKEAILNAIFMRKTNETIQAQQALIEANEYTALEKLNKLILLSLNDSMQQKNILLSPNLLQNPRIFTNHLKVSITEFAPSLIEPIIQQGIAEGTITCAYPKQLAEVLIMLINIWINPLVFDVPAEELIQKYQFFQEFTKLFNIDFLDDSIYEKVENYIKHYK